MGITRPTSEQLRFRSQFTGDHVLDTYLEASEKGGRQLSDLLDDLFDSSGVFRAENFEFRFDEATDKIQFRAGNFASSTAGWTDITTFFKITGTFNSSTTYNNFDLPLEYCRRAHRHDPGRYLIRHTLALDHDQSNNCSRRLYASVYPCHYVHRAARARDR